MTKKNTNTHDYTTVTFWLYSSTSSREQQQAVAAEIKKKRTNLGNSEAA